MSRILYDDEIAAILRRFCKCSVDRASIVDTIQNMPKDVQKRIGQSDPSMWWVCFKPIHDETLLGPFASREEALEEEKAYLKKQLG